MSINKVFFHNSDNIKKIIIKYLLCLIPFILYGVYKNGILLYNHNLISLVLIPKIIYMLIISLGVYLLVDKILFKKKDFWSLDLLNVLIVPLFLPPNINLGLYFVGLLSSFILANILEYKVKFNKIAFCKLFIVLLIILFGEFTYLNPSEKLNIYSLNYWDLLWGRNIGGIASTNIIFGLIVLIMFVFISNYKKTIAIISLLVFIACSLIFSGIDIAIFHYSSAILGLIFLNVNSISTPHNKVAMILYGVMLGLFSAIATIWIDINEGVFISALILSFFAPILDKLTQKW